MSKITVFPVNREIMKKTANELVNRLDMNPLNAVERTIDKFKSMLIEAKTFKEKKFLREEIIFMSEYKNRLEQLFNGTYGIGILN